MYTHTHTQIHLKKIHTHTHTRKHTNKHAHTHKHTHTHTRTHTHKHTLTRLCSPAHMCVLTCTRSFHVFRQSSSWGHRWWVSHIHVTLSQIDVWRNEKTHIMTWETHQSATLLVFVSHRLIIGEMRRLTSWRERHINRTRSSLETGIWPLYPSWVWCVHYLEQNGYFWLVPELALGLSS